MLCQIYNLRDRHLQIEGYPIMIIVIKNVYHVINASATNVPYINRFQLIFRFRNLDVLLDGDFYLLKIFQRYTMGLFEMYKTHHDTLNVIRGFSRLY
jgi:hypothetical protein